MAYSLCWCAEGSLDDTGTKASLYFAPWCILLLSVTHLPCLWSTDTVNPLWGSSLLSLAVVSPHPRYTAAVVYIPDSFRRSSKLTSLFFQVWMTLIDCIVICRLREEFTEKLKKKTSLVLKKRWNLKLTSECPPLLLAELLGKEAKRQVPPQELHHAGGAAPCRRRCRDSAPPWSWGYFIQS